MVTCIPELSGCESFSRSISRLCALGGINVMCPFVIDHRNINCIQTLDETLSLNTFMTSVYLIRRYIQLICNAFDDCILGSQSFADRFIGHYIHRATETKIYQIPLLIKWMNF